MTLVLAAVVVAVKEDIFFWSRRFSVVFVLGIGVYRDLRGMATRFLILLGDEGCGDRDK